MMESVSKAGSAIAPQIVDLGGQVDNVHIEHMMADFISLFIYHFLLLTKYQID